MRLISAEMPPADICSWLPLEKQSIWTVLAVIIGGYMGLQGGFHLSHTTLFDTTFGVAFAIADLVHMLIDLPLAPSSRSDLQAQRSTVIAQTVATLVERSSRLAYFSAPDFSSLHATFMTEHHWHALTEYAAALDSAAVAMAADASGLDFGSLPALVDCSRAQLRIIHASLPPPVSGMQLSAW